MTRRRALTRAGTSLALGALGSLGSGGILGALTGCSDSEDGSATLPTTPPDPPPGFDRVSYGPGDDEYYDLHLPEGPPAPLIVLIHGGFWQIAFGSNFMFPLAEDLRDRGYAVANLEYPRVGGVRGGWPGTFTSVGNALDRLAARAGTLRADRSVTVGHSAGGHLAVWAAARHRLPEGAPGSRPDLRPIAAVSQAGVLDLVGGVAAGVGEAEIQGFLGGSPTDVPDRYAVASPVELVPLGLPVLCVHSPDDTTVPVAQSQAFVEAARAAGDEMTRLATFPGDHFSVIDPTDASWAETVAWIAAAVG